MKIVAYSGVASRNHGGIPQTEALASISFCLHEASVYCQFDELWNTDLAGGSTVRLGCLLFGSPTRLAADMLGYLRQPNLPQLEKTNNSPTVNN